MSNRVDPNLLLELQDYGAVGAEICFNCGTCTAMCPLTDDEHPFPRNMIRLAQLGLEDRLLESTDPWLCYYCGDCAQTCPRQAEPGETMMALRRWLTAQYDPTGHSAKLYTSEKAVWTTIVRICLITLAAFVLFHLVTGFDRIVTGQRAVEHLCAGDAGLVSRPGSRRLPGLPHDVPVRPTCSSTSWRR